MIVLHFKVITAVCRHIAAWLYDGVRCGKQIIACSLDHFKIHSWRQSMVQTVDLDLRIYRNFFAGQVGRNIRV